MADSEHRQIGNFFPDQLDTPPQEGDMSLVDQWRIQGIGYIVTKPVATEAHTVEELSNMGLVGVTLVVPVDKKED